ncbi:MAG: Na+/H+ antiporter subunit E [Rhodobacteraceae bacterium]|nr:Na+/H+ antiporter subunit E [Paracoccaceae bacterium]
MFTTSPRFLRSGFWAAWITFFLIWLAASASLESARVIAGLLVTAGIAGLSTRLTTFWAGLTLSPARLLAGLGYLAVFLKEMVKSNIVMLGYVYAPRIKIAPEIIHIPTRLRGPRERLALTNTLALTPGSLVVDLNRQQIDLHVLDRDLADGAKGSVQKFEPLLEKALG